MWEVFSFALNVGHLRTWQPHQCLVRDVLALPDKLVQVEPVVAWQSQWMAAVRVVGQGASLPPMVAVRLVGQVAHLLVDLAVASSECVWAAMLLLPHDLFLPRGQPLALYTHGWPYMMCSPLEGCYHARSRGEGGSPAWE